MIKLLCFILCIPLLTNAQTKRGVDFEQSLTWEQVKTKAQIENKYIFLDCFATWCGPCKQMDKEVYTNDSVGRYFNDRFVSVKVQMDKTAKDDPFIQSWYEAAESIRKQYKITVFPSYIFLNPKGIIVHKEVGFKSPAELVSNAQLATTLEKTYKDPYARYDSLTKDYKQGIKNYPDMLYMIKVSGELGDTTTNKSLVRDYYYSYLLNLKEEKLYTRENIEFIISFINSKSRFFPLFYPDGTKIDKTMNKQGYAKNIVDQVILIEIISPFLKIELGGMQVSGTEVKSNPDPNWYQLYEIIKNRYSEAYAKRNVLEAQIIWYERQKKYNEWIKYSILKYQEYGIDTTDADVEGRINEIAWAVYQRSTDKVQIKTALQWMEIIMKGIHNKHPMWKAAATDTYACLLYKSGNNKDAIYWEEKALDIAIKDLGYPSTITEFQERLNQMKKGVPTWIIE